MTLQVPEEVAQLPQHIKEALAVLSWQGDRPPPMHYKTVAEMERIRTPPLNIPATIQALTEQATLCHKELCYLAQIAT
jgi:hypothetical protein